MMNGKICLAVFLPYMTIMLFYQPQIQLPHAMSEHSTWHHSSSRSSLTHMHAYASIVSQMISFAASLLQLGLSGLASFNFRVHLFDNVFVHLGGLRTFELESARGVSLCHLRVKWGLRETYVGVSSSFSMEKGSTIRRIALTFS